MNTSRIETLEKAVTTARQLLSLKQQSLKKFQELGRALSYELELEKVGLKKDDVAHPITGAQIGSIDNYKMKRPVRVCKNHPLKPRAVSMEACPECGEPLQDTQIPISFTYLHKELSRHILGVETNDGKRVWFAKPVSPSFTVEES
jgi:hypothetical protein